MSNSKHYNKKLNISLELEKDPVNKNPIAVLGDLVINGSEIIQKLQPESISNNGWNSLHLAAWQGNKNQVEELLLQGQYKVHSGQ